MGKAARAKRLRREQEAIRRDPGVSTMREEPAAHSHRLRSCHACQKREDHIAFLAHRLHQQGQQILALHERLDLATRARRLMAPPERTQEAALGRQMLDQATAPFTMPAKLRSLPRRAG